MADSTPTRRRLPAAERRRQVIAAVLELAREASPEGITTQAIANRVGLTHGALFRHFPDKESLWVEVFAWVQKELGTVLDAAFASKGDALARLERVFLEHVGLVAHFPGAPRILFHELQRPVDSPFHERVRNIIGSYRRQLLDLLGEAKRAGQLSPTLDETTAAMLFIGAVQGLVVQSTLFRSEAEMVDAARRIFPLLLDGFRGCSQ
ncbi:TetR/AcrR family transcriptional regulator [Propionivibrio dicarboxylicus]|uniref:Transcriptional regulator, TetR family n=1 Tax=Propionivibrio dicarboxylicus TaxID=83767 RepID=A0A1G8F1F9_9RHOO|nr:TetR/AcrR family transcriptional regulator [Propionivibrio dicarboxylicus]SDH75914.1 transcriptional regulator, TetR family [Propionivibrio dicarboxylicus]